MVVGVLHDVIEDTENTLDGLREQGFSEEVIEALDHLTKRAGEAYHDFISRVQTSPSACRVKLADLEDNMDIRRIPDLGQDDLARLAKYHRAWSILSGCERH